MMLVMAMALIASAQKPTREPAPTPAPSSAVQPSGESAQKPAPYGSKAVAADQQLTLESMLTYAIQDEYVARAEYEAVILKIGNVTPFSNIVKAEEAHISQLKTLLNAYKVAVPEDKSKIYLVAVKDAKEALGVGVQAEMDNIAMYERLLKEKLPDDVKAVFTTLRDGSKSHLEAFQRSQTK
jgi:hypothetical protein